MEVKLDFQKNILLKEFTSYKIGGPAKYFFIADTKEKLAEAFKQAKQLKLPVFILGGGSNLLVSEKGFKGLVIKIENKEIKIEEEKVFCGAGLSLQKLAYTVAEAGLSGFEWAAGIPGATVGGAVYGNAQAFGEKISEKIGSVQALDLKTLEFKTLAAEQCQFNLKNSIFKKKKNLVIFSVAFELQTGDKTEIQEKIKRFLEYRNNSHPMELPSAGSVFVNPEIKIKNKKLLEKYPQIAEFNEKGVIPAGFLISKSGLQGKIKGGAQISPKHANFIVNLGNAKANDILYLIKLAKEKVKKNFNIKLETEIQLCGFQSKPKI